MRVLIVGAGIAGPALAFYLAKAEAQVTVVEKNNLLLPHGQSVDIQGSAVSVIKQMGLLDEIRRFNTKEKGTCFIDPMGHSFAPFPVKEGTSASLTSEFEILRGDLAAVLFEATKGHPRVKYLFGTTVKEVISNNGDPLKVNLSDGSWQEFDLLVAADGQWSKIRRQYFPPDLVQIIDLGIYAGYWTIPRLPSDNDWCQIYVALGSKLLAIRPDSHGTVRAICTCMPCNKAEERAWKDACTSARHEQQKVIRQQFADAGWQATRLLDAMDQAPDFYFHAIQQVKMSGWSYSRIVCLGDAAWAPSPLTGMGTSLAITGAYVLASELSKLSDNEHPAKALAAYECRFRAFVDESQKIPPFFPAMAHPETPWKRWLFHMFLSMLSKVMALVIAVPWLASKLDRSSYEDFQLEVLARR